MLLVLFWKPITLFSKPLFSSFSSQKNSTMVSRIIWILVIKNSLQDKHTCSHVAKFIKSKLFLHCKHWNLSHYYKIK